ncbi:MAG: Alpha/beta hydrolase fold-3 domain protein [Frondihabitans sp.]|nr:Alpha/beta hydrolase fold-3 domain protein [Frondihabitans sp.]
MHILDWKPLSRVVAKALGAAGSRLGGVPNELTEATADCRAARTEIPVPTRHGTVRCLVYRTPGATGARPLYVNIHGGGYVVRAPEMDDPLCNYLVEHAAVTVLSIDYDVAPKAPFPIAIEECVDVINWAVSNSGEQDWDASRLVVGGQSAGGAITTAVARIARDTDGPALALQVLNYPPLDLTIPGPQKQGLAEHPVVAPWMTLVFDPAYAPTDDDRADPLVSPASAKNLTVLDGVNPLAGMPRTLIQTCELDTLRDEGNRYASALDAAGVPVRHVEVAGVDHGFTLRTPVEPALAAFELIAEEVRSAIA